jgi:hypothetical protein
MISPFSRTIIIVSHRIMRSMATWKTTAGPFRTMSFAHCAQSSAISGSANTSGRHHGATASSLCLARGSVTRCARPKRGVSARLCLSTEGGSESRFRKSMSFTARPPGC